MVFVGCARKAGLDNCAGDGNRMVLLYMQPSRCRRCDFGGKVVPIVFFIHPAIYSNFSRITYCVLLEDVRICCRGQYSLTCGIMPALSARSDSSICRFAQPYEQGQCFMAHRQLSSPRYSPHCCDVELKQGLCFDKVYRRLNFYLQAAVRSWHGPPSVFQQK